MDFSVILVLPIAALIAFITCIVAAVASHSRPRLIWPCALSVLLTAPIFVAFPSDALFGVWAMTLFGLSIWAAMGTVIGALFAKLAVAVTRLFRTS
ncbi:hypothetical protein A8V01_18555 [Novosphingobium guangzhouense]|uniref:Uncharacterized protein n=1 Tax=Novosphingobium guangzhouense TaxID=1850347 RepID=A0A2K2G141_9SPHN|nr:hypothetical protein A8V01_18555 [Novosphingobium guangzhouense]